MLLLRYLHGRPLFCGKRIVSNILRGCSRNMSQTIAQSNEKKQEKLKSQLFPDYQVVYAFPAIRFINLFNLAKTLSTASLGLATVIVGGLYATSVITPNVAVNTFVAASLACAYFHLGGLLLSNNFVGSIYIKDEDDKAIISYVNYWGKRCNLIVDVASIVPIDEAPKNLMKMIYKKLTIVPSKKQLRIYLGDQGTIMKEEKLQSIIGHWR